MQNGNMSRRGFLARSLGGLTAAGLPFWFAKEMVADAQEKGAQANRQVQANDRIVMGAIGTGTNRTRRRQASDPLRGERGVHIMQDAIRQRGVQMIAVCDVDAPNKDFAANIVGRDCQKFADFRELLRNRDIQAVTIGTPDHWHALIALAAMRAGKDVYCEKPLTLTVDEGKALVRVARLTGRILQTGSQQRSEYNGRFRLAAELVRNGRIGRVQSIETRIGANPVGGPFRVQPVPEGLDWSFWQGQTPQVEYVPERAHYEFRWWYEYSGGKMTDWGAHHNDIAQWALNMDASGPVLLEGRGDAPSREANSYNCHPNFEVSMTYANGPNGGNGTVVRCMSRGENGVQFNGEDGKWIFVSRGALRASDQRLIDEPLPQNATRLERVANNSHMGNFIDCVRSRQQPICNVNVGHRSVSVCHLANIAVRTGRRLRWDPQQERFTGENAEEGNRMLSREMRAPWAEYYRELLGNA
jgi:predicted dehydrogenase